MLSIGAILWGVIVICDMWRAIQADGPLAALLLRGAWGLFTVILIASGWGVAFLVANVLMYSVILLLVGVSLLVMPPPLARDIARALMEIAFTIVFVALCWALS